MKTIVEPKQHIDRLWGKQRIREDASYRLMKYVLRVDHEGKVLLHNVVTGQLVVLDPEEAEAVDKLPLGYSPVMERLVKEHYLVPETYEEHLQVERLRSVLRLMDSSNDKRLLNYSILPTTACNARCYYCFEQGVVPATMTEETANEVVAYISHHYTEGDRVYISWFGGEPTIAASRIDQISQGLSAKGVQFFSTMISNGYLFDETMVHKAKELWNLISVQISIDGLEQNTNNTKGFVGAKGSPYLRIMQNVEILLKHEINVSIRMNYDTSNYLDFPKLLLEVQDRFPDTTGLHVYAHPILGNYCDLKGIMHHEDEEWMSLEDVKLNGLAKQAKLRTVNKVLPHLAYNGCSADDGSWMVITPNGEFARCLEQFDASQIVGNVRDGITNTAIVNAWRELATYNKCRSCVLYPRCVRLQNCSGHDRCHGKYEMLDDFIKAIHVKYTSICEEEDAIHGV